MVHSARLFKDLLLPWYSFIRFALKGSVQEKPNGFCGKFADNLNVLKLSPSDYSYRAVIYGSGPSLSFYRQASCFGSEKIPLRVSLNSSIYAGLPTDIAFFETPILKDFKILHCQMFGLSRHLPAFQDRPVRFLFTNFNKDADSDYLSDCSLHESFVLPQFNIILPRFRSTYVDFSLSLAFKVAHALAKIGILPGCIFMRSSLIRALLVLSSLGFKKFFLVGFDGGSSYFYDDELKWPHLIHFKSTINSVYSKPTLSYVKNNKLVLKKSHSASYHSTQDPSLSEYTNDCLIDLLANWLSVEVCRLHV